MERIEINGIPRKEFLEIGRHLEARVLVLMWLYNLTEEQAYEAERCAQEIAREAS